MIVNAVPTKFPIVHHFGSGGEPVWCPIPRGLLMVEALAWAAGHGMPLEAGLKSLPYYRGAESAALDLQRRLGWLLIPTFHWLYLSWFGDVSWTRRINRVIAALESGESLGSALRRHLGRRLPGYYLAGVEAAEADGRLEIVLPLLAAQMGEPAAAHSRRVAAAAPAIVEAVMTVLILAFLLIFIAPGYQEIIEGLGVSWPIPIPSGGAMSLLAFLLISAAVLCGLWLLSPYLDREGTHLSSFHPYISRSARRPWVLHFTRSMALLLRQGQDMATAAQWTLRTSSSPWLKGRVKAFADRVEAGEDWPSAWERSGLGEPVEDWAMRAAAQREDPASGFALVSDWLEQEIESSISAIERWVAPCATIVLGLCVGAICVSVFWSLVTILESLL